MKERSLVAFTLMAQMAAGAYWLLAAVHAVAASGAGLPLADRLVALPLRSALLCMVLGLASSAWHLGSPRNAWRACANLRSSWLSREILFAVLFMLALLGLILLPEPHPVWSSLRSGVAWMCLLFSLGLVWSMARIYRLRTVQVWDSRATSASFFLSAALLGGMGTGALLSFADEIPRMLRLAAMQLVLLGAAVAIMLQLALISLQVRPRQPRALSHPPQPQFSASQAPDWIQALRVLLLMGSAALLAGTSRFLPDAPLCRWALLAAFLMGLGSELLGRMRFYASRNPDLP